MKRMLFNATQAEELRVAIVDGQNLLDLDIESAAKEQRKSNIYKAVITRIEPSLEAAFVDYGADRHGFLPFKEVSRAYFKPNMEPGKARIQDALSVGQELIIQVERDERGNKGAALTTFISLAGRYLVLMPNNPRGGGVSRRIEGEDRQELREVMDQLEVPSGMSLIARTAGIGRSAEEMQWDLNYLLQLWTAIEGAAKSQSGAFLIYQESSLVIRAIRDYFQPDIGEILIDTDEVFEQAQQFMAHVMPTNVNRVKRYRDDVPLFSRFQIEHQIESAYSRQVDLPSGGAIVIDHTEALVSVDVNSGRATKGSDIEETAFRTNCEAAVEIARQLRLRDLGGLIVIDFIDMDTQRNQREVENRLRESLRHDRARVQTSRISQFGLLELSRQRLRPALAETSYITCPRCTGTGYIRSTESAALHIMRILEEEAMKENTGALHVQVPVDVGTFLLNEKRVDIARIEMRHHINLLIVPNRHLETPAHEIVRLRHDQLNVEGLGLPSYRMGEEDKEETYQPPSISTEASRAPKQEAAVKSFTPSQPAPIVPSTPRGGRKTRAEENKPGFFAKIMSWFSADEEKIEPTSGKKEPQQQRRERGRDDRRNRRDGREGREARDNRRGEQRESNEQRAERKERSEQSRNESRQNQGAREEQGEQREARQPLENRRQRGERAEREPRQQQQAKQETAVELKEPVLEQQPGTDNAVSPEAGEGGNSRRRRGRRGGRGRGERRQENTGEIGNADAQLPADNGGEPTLRSEPVAISVAPVSADQQTVAADVRIEPTLSVTPPVVTPASAVAVEPRVAAPVTPVTPPAAPVQTAAPVEAVRPTPVAPVVASLETPAPAPVAAPAPAAPVLEAATPAPAPIKAAQPVQTSAASIAAQVADSGLVMIETSSSVAAPVIEEAKPQLGRKPRQVVVPVAEPLQMVETKPE